MIVLVFVILFLAMLGTAWRQLGSVLRIETVRAKQMTRDQGSLKAAAKALRMLEMSYPSALPASGQEANYGYSTTIDEKEHYYIVIIKHENDDNIWTVTATAVPEEPDCDVIPDYLPKPEP